MNSTPTLQSLAVEARDAFGEDSSPQSSDTPTSFDVVVEVYAQEGNRENEEGMDSCACTALTNALAPAGEPPTPPRLAVQPFVSMTLQFLRVQYPRCTDVKQDRALLSTLFRGHLAEARYARSGSG